MGSPLGHWLEPPQRLVWARDQILKMDSPPGHWLSLEKSLYGPGNMLGLVPVLVLVPIPCFFGGSEAPQAARRDKKTCNWHKYAYGDPKTACFMAKSGKKPGPGPWTWTWTLVSIRINN